MLRIALASVALPFAATLASAQEAPVLVGRVEDNTYISPTGAFKVAIPVLPELGGTITDTPNVVTFQDSFTTHISIAAFSQDATQRWQLSTDGSRDYLKYFFQNFVVADFARTFPNVQIEPSARFLPGLLDGSFIAYILIPGGTMFSSRIPIVAVNEPPRIAKRGNLLFVKNGFIFVVSTELAERVTEGSAYHETSDAEDTLLRERLLDVVNKIKLTPAATKAAK